MIHLRQTESFGLQFHEIFIQINGRCHKFLEDVKDIVFHLSASFHILYFGISITTAFVSSL